MFHPRRHSNLNLPLLLSSVAQLKPWSTKELKDLYAQLLAFAPGRWDRVLASLQASHTHLFGRSLGEVTEAGRCIFLIIRLAAGQGGLQPDTPVWAQDMGAHIVAAAQKASQASNTAVVEAIKRCVQASIDFAYSPEDPWPHVAFMRAAPETLTLPHQCPITPLYL